MSADFEIPYVTIKVGKGGANGSFTVRGMNGDDVIFITTTYLEDLKKVLAKYGNTPRLQKSRVADMVMEIIKDFPMLSVEIISRCADCPGDTEKFRNLSFLKQIEALKAIVELSSDDDDGQLLKKAGAGLVALLETNGLSLGPLSAQLRSIIGASVNQ
jgi:hypothetical protein